MIRWSTVEVVITAQDVIFRFRNNNISVYNIIAIALHTCINDYDGDDCCWSFADKTTDKNINNNPTNQILVLYEK